MQVNKQGMCQCIALPIQAISRLEFTSLILKDGNKILAKASRQILIERALKCVLVIVKTTVLLL